MLVTTEGLIIKQQTVGESDRLITILTKDEGVIKAFAKGANNIKNKNFSATSLLTYGNYVIYIGKESNRINEASADKMFLNIRKDIIKVSLCQYFFELIVLLAPREENANEYLRLILNTLHIMDNGLKEDKLLKSIFELRLLTMSGYMPDLVACDNCGKYDDDYLFFDVLQGTMLCSACRDLMKNSISAADNSSGDIMITRAVLYAMRHIVYSPIEKLFSFKLQEKQIKGLNTVTEKYLLAHLEQKPMTLGFYKTIID